MASRCKDQAQRPGAKTGGAKTEGKDRGANTGGKDKGASARDKAQKAANDHGKLN
jgi:hypothetical protein